MARTTELEGRYYADGAPPCLDCGTTGGYGDVGSVRPERTRGLCKHCQNRHRRAGTIDQFPHTPGHVQRRGHRRTRLASERRREREAIIAARVAEHEGTAALLPHSPDNTARRLVWSERAARDWLRERPWQRAAWDDPRHATFAPASPERAA